MVEGGLWSRDVSAEKRRLTNNFFAPIVDTVQSEQGDFGKAVQMLEFFQSLGASVYVVLIVLDLVPLNTKGLIFVSLLPGLPATPDWACHRLRKEFGPSGKPLGRCI